MQGEQPTRLTRLSLARESYQPSCSHSPSDCLRQVQLNTYLINTQTKFSGVPPGGTPLRAVVVGQKMGPDVPPEARGGPQ